MDKDKRPGNLWLAKWDGSENRALTFGNKGQKHPRWSPDGKWIGFLSGREDDHENEQLWLLPIGGGEAVKINDATGGVDGFAWSPDSKRIASVVHDPDPRGTGRQGTPAHDIARSRSESGLGLRAGLEPGREMDRLYSRRRSEENRIRRPFARDHSCGWRAIENPDRKARSKCGATALGSGRQIGFRCRRR